MLRVSEDSISVVDVEKYKFLRQCIEFVGHVDADGIKQSRNKVRAIVEAPVPQDKNQFQFQIGLLHYYTKFSPNIPSKVNVNVKLLLNDVEWK